MDKFVGRWKMVPERSEVQVDVDKKENIYTIQQVRNNMMMIHSEWQTRDDKNGFLGYTIHTDGVPRKASGTDWKYVTKVRGKNKLTTSKLEDNQVRSMEIREVLDTGELKVTSIHIGESGEQSKNVVYYQKVDSTG
ncbi:hypothetical protein KUV50_06185 [Membranicola marinus]|uniref:Lipocalin-like domain-containing protein n=1 Tax=Membranihabitans marinus TaxID=1227546 RepID=A0A953HMB1_9BACT|nr:hypothetical protein [Membranihabitans marinus]MBY5957709.1 hypothetical protein [Membranihabitans marinus]